MKKKLLCVFVLFTSILLFASSESKDPFSGKTWEGFAFTRTTLEFGTDNSVVVNVGIYENEKGKYSFDAKAGTMVITLKNHGPLDFTYDSSKKILQLNDNGWKIDYKLEK